MHASDVIHGMDALQFNRSGKKKKKKGVRGYSLCPCTTRGLEPYLSSDTVSLGQGLEWQGHRCNHINSLLPLLDVHAHKAG
jgi:hypothetical protein